MVDEKSYVLRPKSYVLHLMMNFVFRNSSRSAPTLVRKKVLFWNPQLNMTKPTPKQNPRKMP